jgi:pyruvyl transferase EpsO
VADPDITSTIERWIPRGSEVAILDVPVHRNVGDMFILAAGARLLEDLGSPVIYHAGLRDYRTSAARKAIGRETILVGLGGGNFGDLYPRYQAHREQIVRDFPRHRVVILPQTIHFTDPHARERSRHVLSRHRDLRIAARDQASLEIARTMATDAALLPDLVETYGGRIVGEPPPGTSKGTLTLIRRDRESRPDAAHGIDWPDLFPEYRARLALTGTLMMAAGGTLSRTLHARWSRYADGLLVRAAERMAAASHVETNRLHAAIVARLAGRPVMLLDNSYGKLVAYYEAWWRNDPNVTLR